MTRYLTPIAAAIALAVTLSACQTTQPLVVTKIQYVPLKLDPALVDLNSCPWPDQPKPADPTQSVKESAISDYLLNGYKAWTCENDTRGAIKTQADRQAQEALDRNSGKAVPVAPVDPAAVPAPTPAPAKKSWFSLPSLKMPEVKLNKGLTG